VDDDNRVEPDKPAAREDCLTCIETVCVALDGLQEYGIAVGDAAGLLVMHGLAMYARDTARAAVALLRGGRTLAAGALTRVVIEHAVLAQWLRADPEGRGQLFLQQSEVERARWLEVVLAADFDMKGAEHSARPMVDERDRLATKPKNVDAIFHTPKNLFSDTEVGRQMYLTYRNLSRFVHPSAATFGRYTELLPQGALRLTMQLQAEQDAEAVSFYLATATVMSALPYLDATGEPVRAAVLAAARRSSVPTTLAG